MAKKQITKWSQIRGKNNLKKWEWVKKEFGLNAVDAAKRLIHEDLPTDHKFLTASGRMKSPEHFAGASNLEYEETVLLNATKFSVTRYAGRGKGHDREEFQYFTDALNDAMDDPRALVYGICDSGRSVNLTRANWEWYVTLYNAFDRMPTEYKGTVLIKSKWR